MPRKFDRSSRGVDRRRRAKERLEAQLEAGTKPVKNEEGTYVTVPLEKEDKARITKEIETLKTRL